MANEIMSVEGQLVGMPLAGPESFSQQQMDYLKRALGVDETVLWSSLPGSTTGNLSEAITNFERVRVYWHYHENGASVQSPCIKEIPVDSSYTRYFLNASFGGTNCYMLSLRMDFSNGFVSFTVQSGSGVYVGTWGGGGNVATIPSGTITNCIKGVYKIVGIHRIAGGN